MKTLSDINVALLGAGAAPRNLLACVSFIEEVLRQHHDQPPSDEELRSRVIRPLIDLQAECSPEAFLNALGKAVQHQCTDVTVVRELAMAYDEMKAS
jgi:hypothetical protein